MAKYNMLLGTAAGTLGDIVLSRRDGVQQQRVRVRKIANPKTQGQAAQRSYVAPVTKFYSPLSLTLERSWEGKNKSKSYAAYLAYNTQMAKNEGWALPKGTSWFPLPYRVSHGTIPAIPQSISADAGGINLQVGGAAVNAAVGSNSPAIFALSMIAAGYKMGDQITIIFADSQNNEDIYAQGNFKPTVVRFFLDTLSGETWAKLGLDCAPSSDFSQWTFTRTNCVAAVVIVSRYEKGVWRRSTNDLLVVDNIMDLIASAEQKQANINTYRPVSNAPQSDIYLNGSHGEGSTITLQTPSGVSYNIIRIDRIDGWAYAVAEDGHELLCYSTDRRASTYGQCLKAADGWAENEERTDTNCVVTNFSSAYEGSQELLMFFIENGFTYQDVYPVG